ncbi:MAG: class I SAM-dependent methyltransferase [Terriglobia bacterium]
MDSPASDPGFGSELSYWDTELSLEGTYPEAILNRSIPERMEKEFPAYLVPRFEELRGVFGSIPRVLDVGSGPLSMLSHGHRMGIFQLTAADPLATAYRDLLRKHNHPENCALVECSGEDLVRCFGPESFEMVWIHNALDHSQDPAKVMQAMTGVLRTGGYLVVQGWTREGTTELWNGLHQHDLYLDSTKRLMCETRGNPRAVCLSDGLPLDVVEAFEPTEVPKMWLRLICRKRKLLNEVNLITV